MNKIDLQKIKDSLVETEFPQYVILEPTNYCNLKCIMCPHDVMPRAKGFMDFELFKRIVDEIVLKSPKSKLWPAVLGESLIGGDRFKRMVDYAVSRQVDIVLNTNGTLLNDDWVSYFSTCGIKEIILGVDGFSKETYEKIRVKGSYENLHAKILKLVKACQDTAGAPNVSFRSLPWKRIDMKLKIIKITGPLRGRLSRSARNSAGGIIYQRICLLVKKIVFFPALGSSAPF